MFHFSFIKKCISINEHNDIHLIGRVRFSHLCFLYNYKQSISRDPLSIFGRVCEGLVFGIKVTLKNEIKVADEFFSNFL